MTVATVERAPWVLHFGFTRTPFSKGIAAKDLFHRKAHAEAVARIHFCVAESALGVLVGDVGAGKTVAVRAAAAALDPTRHHIVYVSNPAYGPAGFTSPLSPLSAARPASASPSSSPRPPPCSPPRRPSGTAA